MFTKQLLKPLKPNCLIQQTGDPEGLEFMRAKLIRHVGKRYMVSERGSSFSLRQTKL